MKEFNLKTGTPGVIETWKMDQIKKYISQEHQTRDINNMGDQSFVGFAFFGPNFYRDLQRVDPDNNYFRREVNHRAVVAKADSQAVGIIALQWVKFYMPFWHYHIRWIDVHQDYKNQGVGTNLVRYLNKADFIKGKVLFLSMLTREGQMYIAKVMKKELLAKDYVLIFEDNIPSRPKKYGIYGGKYWG